MIDADGVVIRESNLTDLNKRDFLGEELIKGKAILHYMGLMHRVFPVLDIPEINMVTNTDTFIVSLLGNYGGSHYHANIKPTVYRLHTDRVWSMKTIEQKKRHVNVDILLAL